MEAKMTELLEFKDEVSGYWLVVDSDDRTVYAYLLDGEQEICADVWLCNLIEPPAEPEWLARPPDPPYLNLAEFGDPLYRIDICNPDLEASWIRDGKVLRQAELKVCGKLLAILTPGESPGMSLAAVRAGPLAHPMSVRKY